MISEKSLPLEYSLLPTDSIRRELAEKKIEFAKSFLETHSKYRVEGDIFEVSSHGYASGKGSGCENEERLRGFLNLSANFSFFPQYFLPFTGIRRNVKGELESFEARFLDDAKKSLSVFGNNEMDCESDLTISRRYFVRILKDVKTLYEQLPNHLIFGEIANPNEHGGVTHGIQHGFLTLLFSNRGRNDLSHLLCRNNFLSFDDEFKDNGFQKVILRETFPTISGGTNISRTETLKREVEIPVLFRGTRYTFLGAKIGSKPVYSRRQPFKEKTLVYDRVGYDTCSII